MNNDKKNLMGAVFMAAALMCAGLAVMTYIKKPYSGSGLTVGGRELQGEQAEMLVDVLSQDARLAGDIEKYRTARQNQKNRWIFKIGLLAIGSAAFLGAGIRLLKNRDAAQKTPDSPEGSSAP